jgi:arylsulfatase A-like enzyme
MLRIWLFGILSAACLWGQDAVKPNVILMLADDMGMGDTSAYQDFTGNSDDAQVHTPAMERLARIGMRFTDAHAPSSRCSPTRYGLLTGRYPWRNRLKHWVLFGSQGDPMIEADRPTIPWMLKESGYRTAMFGKWHVGLRYTRSDGKPATAWEDADLTKPLHTCPLDHGFDVARYVSRSHGTSGPKPGKPVGKGPGHLHGRIAVAATGKGKALKTKGPDAYVLSKLGSRNSDNAMGFMKEHVAKHAQQPFFLYYPSPSNHGPHTPDVAIGGVPVKGASRSKSGEPMGNRYDCIYENDVALGRMLDWLAVTDDPRRPGKKLLSNTIVLFTSDNGAEIAAKTATGPFRSNKGSSYEGGHRVHYLVSWPAGGVGDGDDATAGASNATPISLVDTYATIAEIIGTKLPDLRRGETGAEDSVSVLKAWRGGDLPDRPPLFFNDHKESKGDKAVAAMRLDSPVVRGSRIAGKWKVFFDASLLRSGTAKPTELYNLASDAKEANNLVANPELKPLLEHLTTVAENHRNAGGHRLVAFASGQSRVVDFTKVTKAPGVLLRAVGGDLNGAASGLGIGKGSPVDGGEALELSFDKDVVIENVALHSTKDEAGGFYRMGEGAPLAIYCVNADGDSNDQSGVLSDLGVLKKGEVLRLDSARHFGTEAEGSWYLKGMRYRVLD